MFDSDNEPRNKPKAPRRLDNMSIEELEEWIAEMKADILRAEQEIEKKKKHRDAVSSLFKV